MGQGRGAAIEEDFRISPLELGSETSPDRPTPNRVVGFRQHRVRDGPPRSRSLPSFFNDLQSISMTLRNFRCPWELLNDPEKVFSDLGRFSKTLLALE